jgi:DNA-binding protein H-NS
LANLIELQAQIESLKKQAEAIRTKEFGATVADIREKMSAFGITVKDLQGPAKKTGRKSKGASTVKVKGAKPVKGRKSGAKVEAKFKGPNGEAWTGRGLTPKWLAALVALGHSKDEFAVKPVALA